MKKCCKVLLLIIIILLINGCSNKIRKNIKVENNSFSELKEIGYNSEELELIKSKLNKDNINLLTENDQIKDINKLLNSSFFDQNKLSNYINSYNKTNNIVHSLILVNNNHNDYTSKEKDIIDNKYFLYDNFMRYLKYSELPENNDETIDSIIKMVNTNRDYDFYSKFEEADITNGYLMQINKYFKLPDNYKNDNLITKSGITLDKNVFEKYLLMQKEGQNNNVNFIIISGYRTNQKQSQLYNNYKLENGQEWADKFSARPGFSEHETGFSFDVKKEGPSGFTSFENTSEYNWLKDNAHKFGFIIRYPDDKTNITGYNFEPWHYRYVGEEVATIIYNEKITFDEYYAFYVKGKQVKY